MSLTVSSLVPRGFQWWATFTKPAPAKAGGGQVVGRALVAGRTRTQVLAAARAIAARLSASAA